MSPWRVKGQFRYDGLFVVVTLLNGQPFRMLFDPGAAYSAIKPSVAALLGLRPIGSVHILQGALSDVDCPLYMLDSFQLGFIRLTNLTVAAMTFSEKAGFHGLLGMDFLRQYRFTLECDTATLILRPLRK